jgi:hypothetical protein
MYGAKLKGWAPWYHRKGGIDFDVPGDITLGGVIYGSNLITAMLDGFVPGSCF